MKLNLLILGACVGGAFGWGSSPKPAPPPPVKKIELGALRIVAPYLNKDLTNRYFDFGGDTIIQNDAFVRLTSDRPGQRGWYFARNPFINGDFQVVWELRVHGKGATLYGDGMAMWILDRIPDEGPVFGIEDSTNGLGVVVDTYKNDRPGRAFPYAMAMLGDGKTRYDSDHDGAANELGGCSLRGIHNSESSLKLRLTHVKNHFLALESDRGRGWETCFVVEDITVPTPGHIGFSAQTGELSENHDLISMRAYNLRDPPTTFAEYDYAENGREIPKDQLKNKKKQDQNANNRQNRKRPGYAVHPPVYTASWSWLWFFVKVFFVIAVAIGGYVGYAMYRANRKRHQPPPLYL